jgi:large subunit ribosomal protein L24
MSRIKTHVKKGDTVEVISGNHKKGTGIVLQVLPEKGRAIVEGINMISKHARRSQDRPEGGIVRKEGTVHLSNLRLVAAQEKPAKAKKAARPSKPKS